MLRLAASSSRVTVEKKPSGDSTNLWSVKRYWVGGDQLALPVLIKIKKEALPLFLYQKNLGRIKQN